MAVFVSIEDDIRKRLSDPALLSSTGLESGTNWVDRKDYVLSRLSEDFKRNYEANHTRGLEAIVKLIGRPVIEQKNLANDKIISLLADFSKELEYPGEVLRESLKNTVSVEIRKGTGAKIIGSGVIISNKRVVTNRHVIDISEILRSSGGGDLGCAAGHRSAHESQSAVVDIKLPFPNVDIAVLVTERELHPIGVSIAAEPSVSPIGVLCVGFPAVQTPLQTALSGPLNIPTGAKCVSPGFAEPPQGWSLTHDCTTFQGSSGSPVFSVDSGVLIGIHTGGQDLVSNNAVAAHFLHSELTN